MDGANVYTTVKSLGFEIDYKRLLNKFRARGSLLRSFYYTAAFEDSERPSLQPLLDWLAYNGFTVVTKAGKGFIDQSGRPKIKSNVNVELAIDAMEIAPRIDQDGAFFGGRRSPLICSGCAAARCTGRCRLFHADGGSGATPSSGRVHRHQ